MERRGFIRVLGGGMVVAVAGSGCEAGADTVASDFPADTVQAWRGPQPSDDVRHWALAHAILAPNPHNRQPWLVDLREAGVITLYCDRERLLPDTDPFGRQILVGHGAFLELLLIALAERGSAAELQLFPDGELPATLQAWDDRPVARVRLLPQVTPSRDPLFAQVLKRRTPKHAFDTARPLVPAQLAQLLAAGAAPTVRSGGTVEPATRDGLRELCLAAGRVEVETPRTVQESLRLTRVGPDEIRQHRDGICLNSASVRLFNALGLFDRTRPPAVDSQAYRATMDLYREQAGTAMGFVWLSTPDNRRSTQVLAGRAYVRLQLQATALGIAVHPMSQALQEFDEMKACYDQMRALLLGVQSRDTLQMLCRVGYPVAPAGATPRRPLGDFVRA